jgi:RNA-directed DNA polymerase
MSQLLTELTWGKIDWLKANKEVRRLQRRIYKASLKGDIHTCQQLQQRLIRNPYAKLIAVQRVTTLNKGKDTPGVDGYVATSKSMKMKLAKNLRINGKASPVRRVWIPKPGKEEKRPLDIPTIQDRAKQALAKLALEPEWEARFEPNSYGFRPGRSSHDAIEAIFSNLHHHTDKLVYDADIRKCFDRIDHSALLEKLRTFPLMEMQVKAWLNAGIFDQYACQQKSTFPEMGTPQGGIISPLLANIALHGLEEHLLTYVSSRDFPKPHPGAARGTRAKRAALGIIRYADDFVLIHRNPKIMERVICETKVWLAGMGLEVSEEKTRLRWASQSFKFLGFQIVLVNTHDRYRVKITPSKENVLRLIDKTNYVIQSGKSASSYELARRLRPILLGWANYFRYCECKTTFSKVDNLVYQQIRAWALRRAVRTSRTEVMLKYFPRGRTYKFQNRTYKANWVLSGIRIDRTTGKPCTIILPKIAWISSEKYVKISGTRSVFDGDGIYWAKRTPRYSSLSTRVANLLRIQNGKCSICKDRFQMEDQMEVDHIIPVFKGGKDEYINLQLLHRQCHVIKTAEDLSRL